MGAALELQAIIGHAQLSSRAFQGPKSARGGGRQSLASPVAGNRQLLHTEAMILGGSMPEPAAWPPLLNDIRAGSS